MRLKKSRVSSEEELVFLINEGYQLLAWIRSDYSLKKKVEGDEYDNKLNEWGAKVQTSLHSIFPTELEIHQFLNPPYKFRTVSADLDKKYVDITIRIESVIQSLEKIRNESLLLYTDLPVSMRLYIEDIDSFRKVRDINPGAVSDILKSGYWDVPEDFVQLMLEQILDVPFHKKDWGGEYNDLYTANVVVNGQRTASAFLLKGNGLKKNTIEIRDCGKNGDQLVRLFESPAQLFFVQFVGNVSEAVIKDVEGKVNERRSQGRAAWYCIVTGQDTARLARAYGKV